MPADKVPRVYNALPETGRLTFVRDIQARIRMSRADIRAALGQLELEGRVVRRPPFDNGRPDRWGRTPATRENLAPREGDTEASG
jgi:DNA-binding MarR family transcriptional regulator